MSARGAHSSKYGIQISVGTKFQSELTILIFQFKFARKGYFRSKKENVPTSIEIYIFELV